MTTPLTAVDTTLDEIFGYECSGRDCPHEISGKHYILDDEAKQEVKALIGTIAEQARIEGAKAYNRVLTDELGEPTYMDDDGERWSVYKSMWVGGAVRKANEVTIMKPDHPANGSVNPEAPERLKDYMENKNDD